MINKKFTATIGIEIKESTWPCALWPESVEALGTDKAKKITGTVDDHPITTSFLPVGKGGYVLPVPSHNIDEYIKRLLLVVERLGYGEGLDYLRYKPATT